MKNNIKIQLPGGGHITMSADDERAIKIKQGYEYRVNDKGKLIIGAKKINYDLDAFRKKLENKNATLTDIQDYLLTIIKE